MVRFLLIPHPFLLPPTNLGTFILFPGKWEGTMAVAQQLLATFQCVCEGIKLHLAP